MKQGQVKLKNLDAKFYLYKVWTTGKLLNVFGKAGKAFCLVPFLKILIATITPGIWPVLCIAHQTLPIAMAQASTMLFEEVVPDKKYE